MLDGIDVYYDGDEPEEDDDEALHRADNDDLLIEDEKEMADNA